VVPSDEQVVSWIPCRALPC